MATASVRLDVWLDVACLFPTRSRAKAACEGGKISRLYSYPLPSCAEPYHRSLPFGYVQVLPSACSQG